MDVYGTKQIRNVVLLGHGGAGKSTVAEALAYLTGVTKRMGKVSDGNTISDYDKEEIKRQFSISTTMVPIEYQGAEGKVKINLLDTPGYFDFVGEVEEAVSVADAAIIVVNCKAGIEVGTEKAWELCEEYRLPRIIFVTNMDDDHASFRELILKLEKQFGRKIAPFQVPIRENEKFVGFVNAVKMEGRRFTNLSDYEECEIDNGLQGVKRTDLIVAKYKRDSLTGLESVTIAVIKGTSGDNYTDPEYVEGNILNGDDEDDFLLYRVKINGLAIEKVETMFNTLLDVKSIYDKLVVVNNLAAAAVPNSKITQSSAVTASGYVLDAREKNASISGTLAYMLNNFSTKIDLLWSNNGSNFVKPDNALARQSLVSVRNFDNELYDAFIIMYGQGQLVGIRNYDGALCYLIQFLNLTTPENNVYIAFREVKVERTVEDIGNRKLYVSSIYVYGCQHRSVMSGGSLAINNNNSIPYKIYGIRK